jgi:hypothetical protein
MKKLAKFKVTINKQKITDKTQVDERMVADSVANDLINEGKAFDAKYYPANRIETAIIWEEVKEKKEEKETSKKKK